MDFVIFEAIVGIGSVLIGKYLSRMKTDLAAA